jgi:predicted enzyme related to lactoylglutathione lyase
MAGANVGRFAWYDLITSDTKAAIDFYGAVVGDIPKIGRFAVIADPQGAAIAIFSGETDLHDETRSGEFGWNELLTTDQNAAFAFYSEIFGWNKIREHELGPMGKYLVYGIGQRELGGMFTKLADMTSMPTAWTYYANVSDLDAASKRAAAKGGKITLGPMEVPNGARITQLIDPQGAVFALHEPAKTKRG